jgi:hypothetical protein
MTQMDSQQRPVVPSQAPQNTFRRRVNMRSPLDKENSFAEPNRKQSNPAITSTGENIEGIHRLRVQWLIADLEALTRELKQVLELDHEPHHPEDYTVKCRIASEKVLFSPADPLPASINCTDPAFTLVRPCFSGAHWHRMLNKRKHIPVFTGINGCVWNGACAYPSLISSSSPAVNLIAAAKTGSTPTIA